MKTGTYILKRSGSSNYYARILIPDDLRQAYGRSEIWKSLKTGDKKLAQQLGTTEFAKWLADFDSLRRTRPATDDDLQRVTFEHYARALVQDGIARMPSPAPAEGKDFDAALPMTAMANYDRSRRLILRKVVSDHLTTGETVLVEGAADDIIMREGFAIEKGSPAYRDLCQRIQRAELEALKRAAERDQGEWGGTPSDSVVKPPAATAKALVAKPGETIMELYDAFHRERAGSARPDTWAQNRKVVELFSEYVGKRAHVTAINRKAISGWKQQLMLWPRKAADISDFAGLDFKGVIAKNAALKKPVISDKTINRYLSGLGKFCLWLLANDHIETDVMRGQYLGLDKSKKKVRPYSSEQLTAIFQSPLFTFCERDGREHLPGTHKVRDWRYWLPLLGLYTGARLGELCQLLTSDVRKNGETWIAHVTMEGDEEKRTKTVGSQRVIPLHPRLIEMGFLEFHATMVADKEARLFPELKRDQRGHYGEPSRFFGRYLLRVGVKAGASTNYHSFRHGIADAFRRAGYRDEEFAPLLGHVKSTTTARYGNLREGELSAFKRMIDAVVFPGFDEKV